MVYSFNESPDRGARLLQAHRMAAELIDAAERTGLFRPGVTESQLSRELQAVGRELFGPLRHWHKRIVRSGANTLCTYGDDPPDLVIERDDMLFVDFGPVFGSWEADIGRTYVIGEDPDKIRLRDAVESAWRSGRDYFAANRDRVTGADMYAFASASAAAHGYEYGNWHAGHLIGNFPHELIQGELAENYLHPANRSPLCDPDGSGHPRTWIYEIHFVDRDRGYGGFFEQWLELED
jgi:Xaa-Pro dipeptidase